MIMSKQIHDIAHLRFEIGETSKTLTFKVSAALADHPTPVFTGPVPVDMPAQLRTLADAVEQMADRMAAAALGQPS